MKEELTLPLIPQDPEERYKNIRPAWEVEVEELKEEVKKLKEELHRQKRLISTLMRDVDAIVAYLK